VRIQVKQALSFTYLLFLP